MTCILRNPIYPNVLNSGIYIVGSNGDGYSMNIRWNQAYSDSLALNLAYNIYFSTILDNVFTEGPKFVVIDPTATTATISEFPPGVNYYFAVKAMEYDPSNVNLTLLPDAYQEAPVGIKVYPTAQLLSDMSAVDTIAHINDISIFPAFGVVQLGYELMVYSAKDEIDGYLLVTERGAYGTNIRSHNTDGYDGYVTTSDNVNFFKGFEDIQNRVYQSESKFSYPTEPFLLSDGYRENIHDIVTTDYSASDAFSATLRPYDYAGWHGTDPADIIKGVSIGSYIGGEFFCADSSTGVGQQVRGVTVQEQNNQRQEVLLSVTGLRCVLFRRMWTGKRCRCVDSSRESPMSRCNYCYGVGYVGGYSQYFDSRRSDGNIMVRFSPRVEDLDLQEPGLESKVLADCWTTVAPSLKDRDFLIQLNEDGYEEWRYEILNVTKNNTFVQLLGMQKFSVQRVRKTDPIYMVPGLLSSATMPSKLNTSISGITGYIPPHMHQIVIDENITSINQINQMTSVVQGHNHAITKGVVVEALGHTHTIVL